MGTIPPKKVNAGPDVTVRQLVDGIAQRVILTRLNGEEGLDRVIPVSDLNILGLALAGFLEAFPGDRIQIIGIADIAYLHSLTPEDQRKRCAALFQYAMPCLIATNNLDVPPAVLEEADRAERCVFRADCPTTPLYYALSSFLNPYFAPRTTIHGTLVDVYGMGLLFTGRSGIGKSEIALDLIERGHRLVADDVIILKKMREHSLVGAGVPGNNHHMEIRGLGIMHIPRLFGIRSIREEKRVEVEVRLEDVKDLSQFERTGLDGQYAEYLGVKVPLIKLPIFAGKNITVISETIALNHILKIQGYDAATEFNKQLLNRMDTGESP